MPNKKITRKIIGEGKVVLFTPAESLNCRLEEARCPLCKRKWFNVVINDLMLIGEYTTWWGGDGWQEACNKCALKRDKKERAKNPTRTN